MSEYILWLQTRAATTHIHTHMRHPLVAATCAPSRLPAAHLCQVRGGCLQCPYCRHYSVLYVRKLGVIGEYVWRCMCGCVAVCLLLLLARCACYTFPTLLTTATLNVAGAKAHAAASCSRNQVEAFYPECAVGHVCCGDHRLARAGKVEGDALGGI